MAHLLTLAVIAALLLAGFLLFRYGNIPRQHIIVTLSVLMAWCFSFLIVFTIPLDVTNTLYRQCLQEHNDIGMSTTPAVFNQSQVEIESVAYSHCQAPWGMIPDDMFPNLWRIIYWSSQFLTWLIMPLMQSYLKAGDFTIKGKLKSALVENAIYYSSYLFICGILLIYIAAKGVSLDWQKLKAIASSSSNTWGLFLLVLLLGYALVEVPRSLWNNAMTGFTLQYAYFKLAKLSSSKAEAEENVDDVLESLQGINRAIPNDHELRPCVETILRKVPTELIERAIRNYARGGSNGGIPTNIPTEKSLIRIHKQVIKSLQTLQRSESLWSVQVETVLYLEDISRNMHSADRLFTSEFPSQRPQLCRALYSPSLHWYWECKCKTHFLKALSILTAIMSFMVVWSELTFFNRQPVLSIFAQAINIAKYNYKFFTIELFSMIVLCYLFYCTYSTILRIRFLNLYYLAPHHQTNEHSLIFSGMLLCRLTPPMCLNFLGLIHMDSHIIEKRILETYYTQIMGHMDVLSIISDGFNIYFPMCMLAFCLATWFSLGSRILNAIGFQQFLQNETIATELVQEGKDLIAREKRRRHRAEDAMSRRRDTTSVTNEYIAKYRNFGGTTAQVGALGPLRTPTDGLLCDRDRLGYETVSSPLNTRISPMGMTRSLSEEINERFGVSTHLEIDFKGLTQPLNDTEKSSDNFKDVTEGRERSPLRGLFDDV
ncbi:LMBR1 domain-containing protein 2 homolog [Zeugodacus cucurbitae]|nr:LMBR1 domain-containing protein 2 homolog [Zeugodacus cucurbitae]